MVTRDFRQADKRDIYRILTSLVIPRPIAWITTLSEDGTVNLAPYSSFMGVFNPPIAAICCGRRRDGSLKDTHRNLRRSGEAVVHIADTSLLEPLNASGAEAHPGVSEMERLGLGSTPSILVAPPRLPAAPVALECKLREEHPLGPLADMVLLDVLMAHAAERIWDGEHDCADASLWRPLARLGSVAGPDYGAIGEFFRAGQPKGLPPGNPGRNKGDSG